MKEELLANSFDATPMEFGINEIFKRIRYIKFTYSAENSPYKSAKWLR